MNLGSEVGKGQQTIPMGLRKKRVMMEVGTAAEGPSVKKCTAMLLQMPYRGHWSCF